MDERNIFEFDGPTVVSDFAYSRTRNGSTLSLTFTSAEGRRRLLFENPEPVEELFAIIETDQVWVSADRSITPGRIKVEYWTDGYHEFSADSVVDLEAPSYDTNPDTPVHELNRGRSKSTG